MALVGPFSSGAAVGSAGSATANLDTPTRIDGRLVGIYVLYNDSPPAGTTDVTIKTVGTTPAPPTYDLLVLTDAATDGWFYPQVQIDDTAGAPIADEYTPQLVHDYLNIAIAGANAADSVTVWLIIAPF